MFKKAPLSAWSAPILRSYIAESVPCGGPTRQSNTRGEYQDAQRYAAEPYLRKML
jgi:hypothetical protein